MSAQTSAVLSNPQPLTVMEVSDYPQMQTVRNAWNNLLLQSPGLSLFATPEWLFPWWQAYGAHRTLCVLICTSPEAGVVGILPLYREAKRALGLAKIEVLRLVGDGSGDSDDLDFIVKKGYAERVCQAFMGWLSETRWDICELNCLSSNSEVAMLLKEEVSAKGWKTVSATRPVTKVKLAGSWEAYLKQLSSKERGKIGNRLRRLESRHRVEFRRCDSTDELPEYLKTLYYLHQKRWAAKGEPGSFSVPERRNFYQEMAAGLQERGWLELWQMEMDGVPVASQIGLRYGDCLYSLQEGFDPAYASDSVGYVLRSYVLRNSIESGVRTYDFLCGDQDSKQRWGADTGNYYVDLHFARPYGLGAAQMSAEQIGRQGKDWLKSRLSSGALEALQSLRNRKGGKSDSVAGASVAASKE